MCRDKYPRLEPYASYYELKSLYEMLQNLMGCDNRKEFKIQELNIRWRILFVYFRCCKWKEISDRYRNEMKTYFIVALVGQSNIERLVKMKRKVVGE